MLSRNPLLRRLQWALLCEACPAAIRALYSGQPAAFERYKRQLTMGLFDRLPQPIRDRLNEHGGDLSMMLDCATDVRIHGVETIVKAMDEGIQHIEEYRSRLIAEGRPYG